LKHPKRNNAADCRARSRHLPGGLNKPALNIFKLKDIAFLLLEIIQVLFTAKQSRFYVDGQDLIFGKSLSSFNN
jgi:hypothetical protein